MPAPVFRILPGLPTSGPPARPYPAEFGRTGKEGFVVEFLPDTPDAWTGNFRNGLGGYSGVLLHPDGGDVVVCAQGQGYQVDPRSGEIRWEMGGSIANAHSVRDPAGFVLDRDQIAWVRIAPDGAGWRTVWHTRRLSWDGFQQVVFDDLMIAGLAWSPVDPRGWVPFFVYLATGRSSGGAYEGPPMEGWEQLAAGD